MINAFVRVWTHICTVTTECKYSVNSFEKGCFVTQQSSGTVILSKRNL